MHIYSYYNKIVAIYPKIFETIADTYVLKYVADTVQSVDCTLYDRSLYTLIDSINCDVTQ
jgi:hypothetical protein